MDDYALETLQPDHYDELTDLMRLVFGIGNARELLDWKYRRNPAGRPIGKVARTPDGGIAAFYGMIPEDYRFGDMHRRLVQSCDTMTHPDHRRLGLFERLALTTYADATAADPGFFAIGFSGPMSTPGFMKMGWANPFSIPHQFKPRLLAAMNPRRRGLPTPTATPADGILRLMQTNERSRANSKVYDRPFLEWRLSSPAKNYMFIEADGAYAIYQKAKDHLDLLDYWSTPGGDGSAVIGSLDREAAGSGGKGILTVCQRGGALERALRRKFYLRNDLGRGPASDATPFITYGTPPTPDANASAGWNITAVDFDSL